MLHFFPILPSIFFLGVRAICCQLNILMIKGTRVLAPSPSSNPHPSWRNQLLANQSTQMPLSPCRKLANTPIRTSYLPRIIGVERPLDHNYRTKGPRLITNGTDWRASERTVAERWQKPPTMELSWRDSFYNQALLPMNFP